MPTTTTELALAILVHLQRWPYDAENGQRLSLDLDTLARQTQHLVDAGPSIHWPSVLPDLARQRLVVPMDGSFQLTTEGRRRGQAAHRRWMARGFETLVQRVDCPAYDAFCQDTMGLAVGQLSPLDDVQLTLLLSCVQGALEACDATEPRLLDLGCGTGGVTQWLAQHTDAIAYGVDLAVRSRETPGRRHSVGEKWASEVRFHRADITALRLPEASFQALVAVDVVSFLDDPAEVILDWLRLLTPGGRLVILGSEHPEGGTETAAEHSPPLDSPSGPRFLPHLSTPNLRASCVDLSAAERRIYRRQRDVLPRLRDDFEAQGQTVLYDLLWREAQRYGHWADSGQSRRWLTVLRPV